MNSTFLTQCTSEARKMHFRDVKKFIELYQMGFEIREIIEMTGFTKSQAIGLCQIIKK